MIIIKKRILFPLLFSMILFTFPVKAECIVPYENLHINSDTSFCQGTYNLNDADMNGAIIINASDIVLDCNESTITGNRGGGSAGIANGYFNKVTWEITEGHDNVTLKNCNIDDHFIGIFWVNASEGNIENNDITDSVRNGIEVDFSDGTTLSNNDVDHTYGSASIGPSTFYAIAGIELRSSNSSTLIQNSADYNPYGIMVDYLEYVTLEENSVQNNEYGIALIQGEHTAMLNNSASGNFYAGLITVESLYLDIIDNNAEYSLVGIGFQANHSNITGNTVSNARAGIGLVSGTLNDSLVGSIIKNVTKDMNITYNPHPPTFGNNISIRSNVINQIDILPGYYPSGYGISFEECENIQASDNEIDDTEFTGILVLDSKNNEITENTLTNNGGYGGIFLTIDYNNSVTDNTVYDNDYGIYANSSLENVIESNNATSNLYDGIRIDKSNTTYVHLNSVTYNNIGIRVVDTSDFDIADNLLDGNTEANLVIDPSSDFSVTDNVISNSNYGIKILDSFDGTLLRNLFEYNNYSIYFSSSEVVTEDSVISDSGYLDFWAEDSNTTFTNTSFDSEKANITGPSSVPVKWYLDVRVLDEDQNPVQNALIEGIDNQNNLAFNLTTDSSGYIPTQELTEYIENSTSRISYSPYIITVTKEDFNTNIDVIDINQSVTLEIVLTSSSTESNLDIDPNVINMKGNGKFIKAFIEVPGQNVSNIDINTVMMNETIPAINDTKYGFVKNPVIEDRDNDGLLEFMAVFYKDAAKTILQDGNNTLTVTGDVDGYSFDGSDTVFVINAS